MESIWNYEKDLELVKQKLSTCSPSVKTRIQMLVTEILEVPLADDADEPPRNSLISTAEDCSKVTQGSSQSVAQTPEYFDLDPALILNVIRLMQQFKKDFKGTSKLLEEKVIVNSAARKLFQATSWAQLENLWHVFSVYIQKTVEPKCPLEVDLVLKKIYRYLPTYDLLNCRLVSRAWNEKIIQWEYPKRNRTVRLTFNKMVQIIESSVTSPFIFSKLKFDIPCLKVDECNSFFTSYGEYVKSLELILVDLDLDQEYLPIRCSSMFQVICNLRLIFQNVKQLQELEISDRTESVLEQVIFTQEEWRTFTLPNVRSLTLDLNSFSDFSRQFSEGFFSMLHNVNSIRFIDDSECFEQLRVGIQNLNLISFLNVGYFEEDEITETLSRLFVSLQTQNLEILETCLKFETDEEVVSFENFLQSQRQTLKTFTLTSTIPPLDRVIRLAQFPIMQKLETLMFHDWRITSVVPLTPHQLPKLSKTSFYFQNLSNFFAAESFTTVQELSGKGGGLKLADWKNLGSRFPNLSRLSLKLKLHRNSRSESELFLSFPNLEYLDLSVKGRYDGDTEINRLLSGFTLEGEYILSQFWATSNSIEEFLKIQPVRGSLRDMKKLKELRLNLRATGENQRSAIDNVGVQFGLMKIQPLDKLSIFGDFTIYEDGAALLKNLYHRSVIISPNP